jgi:hypothetical protein
MLDALGLDQIYDHLRSAMSAMCCDLALWAVGCGCTSISEALLATSTPDPARTPTRATRTRTMQRMCTLGRRTNSEARVASRYLSGFISMASASWGVTDWPWVPTGRFQGP